MTEIGNEAEFETRNGKQDEMKKHNFSSKKQENRENTKKNWKNRTLQEIQKQDSELSENAENGNEIWTRFQKQLITETRIKTRYSQMSRYHDSKTKKSIRWRPRQDQYRLPLAPLNKFPEPWC